MPISNKAVIMAGWKDAPWLTEDTKQKLLEDTPPHLRKARSEGIPSLGSGNVYPMHLEDFVVDDFKIPAHYKRMYALDVGWNRTACLWCAIDPDTGVMYLYSEHYQGHSEPYQHAMAIKGRGDWIPGVIDPASKGRSQVDGKKLMSIYKRDHGLKIREAKNEVEAGIYAVYERLSSGKLKVFKSLINFQKEYMLYRRDINGKIIKEHDHLMDALRYLVLNYQYAQHTPVSVTNSTKGIGYAGHQYRA